MTTVGTAERKADYAGGANQKGDANSVSELCIIDIGEHGRRAVRRLRHGEGKLMDKVEEAITSLRKEGIFSSAFTQTVVVVVREEPSLHDLFGDDDDDDDYDDD